MNSILNTRRINLAVNIGGHDATAFLEPYVLSFSYTDNASGKADSIALELQDRQGKWANAWAPKKGTQITASFTCLDWIYEGETLGLNCGSFKIDEVEYSGSPDKISLKAISASLGSELRETQKNKGWENYNLQSIAAEIASNNGLSLMYSAPNHNFTRQDQREESDLSFLTRLARERGVNVKVHDNKLALYEAKTNDSHSPALTIAKTGGQFSPKRYSFKEKSQGTAFSSCEVNYRNPDTQEVHSYIFDAKGNRISTADENSTKIWPLNQRVESEAEARTLAQGALRQKNEGECTGNLELMGHPNLVAGININLTDFGRFSGTYFVEKSEHRIGSGYSTSAEIRRILNY